MFADIGDYRAKGVSNGFTHALYVAMDESYQKFLDAEVLNDNLSVEQVEDGQPMSFKDYEEVIEKILKVVAKDSTTDSARRIISSGRQVFNCKRSNDESFAAFAE